MRPDPPARRETIQTDPSQMRRDCEAMQAKARKQIEAAWALRARMDAMKERVTARLSIRTRTVE